MLDAAEFWDPNDWENYTFRLLQDRHGVLDVHKVPAQHSGDFGIDYLCKKDAVIYQCYAVQEPISIADRALKQKIKITDDINKLCSNKKALKDIIGTVKIKHWVLLVPLHNSAQVNGHLTLKTKEVLSTSLAYIDPSFQVSIQDLDSFASSSRLSHIQALKQIILPITPVLPQDISDWTTNTSSTSSFLLDNLSNKLRKRVNTHNPAALPEAISNFITYFLERENALASLRAQAPNLFEDINKTLRSKGRFLDMAGPPSEGVANTILRDELEGLVSALMTSITNFSRESAEIVAYGTVSEWLMRCPLDFPPYNHVS